jgi:ribose transport system substrate-binding protein
LALEKLEGKKQSLPHHIKLPLPLVTPDEMNLCKTGAYKELASGCNVFEPSLVPPGWLADIYGRHTPEVGFQAALHGKPEPHRNN